jgi:hypothetical protein
LTVSARAADSSSAFREEIPRVSCGATVAQLTVE